MATWTFRAYDLATGAPSADLRLTSWYCEDILNDAGQFNCQLEPRNATLTRQAIDATLAGRSLIVPFRNGLPLGYAGVVWSPDPPEISGASLLSWFDEQGYDATTTWTAADQHTMMAALIDWFQTNRGSVQIDTSQVGTSGVLRDQTWTVYDQKDIGEAFRQKADNLNGFDFDFRVELDAGELVRRLRMWTPRRGRIYVAKQNPTFTVGGNGNARYIPSARADGSALITDVVALGAETGAVTTVGSGEIRHRLVARASLTDTGGAARRAHTIDRQDITDLTTLQAAADGWLYYHQTASIDDITLEVNPDDRTWPWDSYELGDDCLVKIHAGVPWWPTGLEAVRRITAKRWTKNADGETLHVVTGRPLE